MTKSTTVKCKHCRNKFSPVSNSDQFTMLVKSVHNIEVVKEHPFHPTRKWRFDYAIIAHKIAIEVEGGVFTQGRHTRGAGFMGDMEKYNQAVVLGWKLLRVMPNTLLTQNTLELIKQLL